MPHLQYVLGRDVCNQLPVAHGHPSLCALLPSEASCNHTGNGTPSLPVCPLVNNMSVLLRVCKLCWAGRQLTLGNHTRLLIPARLVLVTYLRYAACLRVIKLT